MKKAFVILLAAIIMICSCAFAEENDAASTETFSWRNIRFLMTIDEVKAIETLALDHEENSNDGNITLHYNGTVAGIDASEVNYRFTGDDHLLTEIYVSYNTESGDLVAENSYKKISSGLEEKYGTPLGNKKGKVHSLVGRFLKMAADMYSTMSLLDPNYSLEYGEWLLDYGDTYVKIDHELERMGKGEKRSIHHDVTYSYFTKEALNAITDDL